MCSFERAVICGKLWFQACQAASQDLPKVIPVSFQTAQQYVGAYEELIFEEARQAVLHSKLDSHSCKTRASITRCRPARTQFSYHYGRRQGNQEGQLQESAIPCHPYESQMFPLLQVWVVWILYSMHGSHALIIDQQTMSMCKVWK